MLAFFAGILAGALVAGYVVHLRALARSHATAAASDAERARLEERIAQERSAAQGRLEELEKVRGQFADAFKALSADALKHNNASFLDLARVTFEGFQKGASEDLERRQKAIADLTQPIRERLEKFDGKIEAIEKARIGAYVALDTQLKALVETHLPQLHRETASLVSALRRPEARGRWGEVQLRRVVEMAGMLEHVDFVEQETVQAEGARLRPDMVVRLPGGHHLVVDAKAPVDAYLSAVEATDESAREVCLAQHARQVRAHIDGLGRKAYFEQFDPSPEFVVMFVPGEAFFSAALAKDPGLIDYGVERKVIPASPTTLIALLKAVAYGWRQQALAENAAEVAALGKELYDRIAKLAEHWTEVGSRLDQAVKAYNQSVATLETRVLVSARRFQTLKAAPEGREVEEPEPVERSVRGLVAGEFGPPPAGSGT